MTEKNPFAPPIERVPLRLTLDALSFERLRGEQREAAEYLCQLCWTEAIDAIWGWRGEPIVAEIPQTTLGPVERDHRLVRLRGEPPPHFIGSVRCWSQFGEWADQMGYDADEREWFVYYGALNHFHSRHDRHYLVTADERLLEESEAVKGWFRRGQPHTRIRSVSSALFLCGLAMKAHGRVFYEASQPNHTIYTSMQSMYEYLARDFLAPRRALLSALERRAAGSDPGLASERAALVEGISDRLIEILRARDRIALLNGIEQDSEALDETRYELRSMIASAAGAIDAIAVLAQTAFPFEVASPSRITLRDRDFRKALKCMGATELAASASAALPYMHFVWSLRNPIFHRQGLSGYTLHQLGSIKLSQISVSEKQVRCLDALCAERKESAEDWGLRNRALAGVDPSVDPWVFAQHLAAASIGAIRRLHSALVADCGGRDLDHNWTGSEKRAIRRFRWLSGFELEGR